jgi:LysR family transcriptional regulator, transcriptional activator for bauABCD operon
MAAPALHDIDLKLLRVFAAVVENGGFAPAQAVLNISLSRLSSLIAELERRLGMRLCHRGRVGFRLTDKGAQVYQSSLKLMNSLEGFRAEVGALRGRLVGNLAIGMVDNIVSNPECRLSDVISRFCARDQQVRVSLHIDAPPELEQRVMDGRLDLVIGAFHHTLPALDYRPLFDEEQTLYCGAGHPLFQRSDASISLENVSAGAYAGRGYPEETRPLQLRPDTVSDSMEGLAIFVLSGRFIAYLPTHYALQWVERGQMRPILPRRLAYRSQFHAVTRKAGAPTLVMRAFLADLAEAHAKSRTKRSIAQPAQPPSRP